LRTSPSGQRETDVLSGLTAVVTGGNGGIGLGLAEGLVRAGANVAVWGRDANKNATAAAHLAELGGDVKPVVCDVTNEADVAAAMATTVERFGHVDSMFANAGIPGASVPFTDLTLEEWRSVFAVNVEGVFLCFREAARHLVARGAAGSLVGVSSIAGSYGVPRKTHYGASKLTVVSIVRSVAVELASRGIRCNALAPGWVATDLVVGGFDNAGTKLDRFSEAIVGRTAVRRWGQPADMAAAAVFLARPDLPFHTGDVVTVDGGYSIS
jgi:NAD(P)-dependent dehydrogenase (short-subunit alcohol dehydrogenase family)